MFINAMVQKLWPLTSLRGQASCLCLAGVAILLCCEADGCGETYDVFHDSILPFAAVALRGLGVVWQPFEPAWVVENKLQRHQFPCWAQNWQNQNIYIYICIYIYTHTAHIHVHRLRRHRHIHIHTFSVYIYIDYNLYIYIFINVYIRL